MCLFQLFEDPEKLQDQGPFYACMFVVLGAFAAFGGTVEVSERDTCTFFILI